MSIINENNMSLTTALCSFTKKCLTLNSTLHSIDSISTLDQTFEMLNSSVSCSLDEILLEDEKNLQDHCINDDKNTQEMNFFLDKYDKIDKFLDQEGLHIISTEETAHRKFSNHFVQLNNLPSLRGDLEDDVLNSSINSGASCVMRRRLAAKKANSAKTEANRGCMTNSLLSGNFNLMKINSENCMHVMEHPSA
jgi:hypothetical protein